MPNKINMYLDLGLHKTFVTATYFWIFKVWQKYPKYSALSASPLP